MQKWQILLLVGATAFGCGGDSKGGSDPDLGAGGSAAGGTNSAGATAGTSVAGAGGAADSGGASPTGGQAQTAGGTLSGGQDSETSGAGGDDNCDVDLLWETVTLYAGVTGTCDPQLCECSDTILVGAIRFDAEGRVTNVTGFKSSDAWWEFVADNRWPCYASQGLPYCCDVAP